MSWYLTKAVYLQAVAIIRLLTWFQYVNGNRPMIEKHSLQLEVSGGFTIFTQVIAVGTETCLQIPCFSLISHTFLTSVSCIQINFAMFIPTARTEAHIKLFYNLIEHNWRSNLDTWVCCLKWSNEVRSLGGKNSHSGGRSTFCLLEREGSRGLFGVKALVAFAEGPSSSSANKTGWSNIKVLVLGVNAGVLR